MCLYICTPSYVASIYIYVCIWVVCVLCAWLHVCMSCIYMSVCIYTYEDIYISVFVYFCYLYVWMYVSVDVCMCVYNYVLCVCECILYFFMYVYICMSHVLYRVCMYVPVCMYVYENINIYCMYMHVSTWSVSMSIYVSM